ncbi:hypothetical protein E4T66_18645 [Sinimarinibacterium sp. CAU 1509]|uniref:hypothetical protein n=1 Tax=Sinimarinibacterium sp. CAU 1509 TaxID=2562283 RepID=UPI0010ABCC88|nr:hypothetical protein [Sinimarinibacterium sp. CAU 1509]TJY57427.1 hypothetical protein E4T66_18645 [Sinimarinibacterium sp. CAU 1509]
MNAREFRRLRLGDEVYVHFSNAYRAATVIALEQRHIRVEGKATKGGVLTRRATYQSVDTRAVGRKRLGIQDFACDYCGGNNDNPQDHRIDCPRPSPVNAPPQARTECPSCFEPPVAAVGD